MLLESPSITNNTNCFIQGTHAYMVTYEGAKKLLALCPKATYHVDLDVRELCYVV